MLQGGFTSVLQVKSRDELLAEVVGFTRRLGFETVNVTAVVDRFRGESDFVWVNNAPSAYRQLSETVEEGRRDPVAQHCKRASVPIIWNQDTYTSCGLGEKWEVQARFGYRTGIALALHLPEGRHFFIGVDRDQALPNSSAEVTRLVADLQLFAVHAQDAALRVLVPPPPQMDFPSLTPRELEGLRWTMEGKTAWEVGNILGISERTAVLHINNATHKLGCVNKHQAVLKALRLGLIR
ncbi:autoinducer binding domain-containing protein [Piscinibacter sp. XHJ-5]|uniref:helix-turn-helix transcriptional regulator n=1 Tax=Piscinibacter sp. XHJ-5 TaxID=3037797 RepID=UPI002453637D|nr:autoinducer binding domain-containing protein [Piscinibacter sp. XHJ-5]